MRLAVLTWALVTLMLLGAFWLGTKSPSPVPCDMTIEECCDMLLMSSDTVGVK